MAWWERIKPKQKSRAKIEALEAEAMETRIPIDELIAREEQALETKAEAIEEKLQSYDVEAERRQQEERAAVQAREAEREMDGVARRVAREEREGFIGRVRRRVGREVTPEEREGREYLEAMETYRRQELAEEKEQREAQLKQETVARRESAAATAAAAKHQAELAKIQIKYMSPEERRSLKELERETEQQRRLESLTGRQAAAQQRFAVAEKEYGLKELEQKVRRFERAKGIPTAELGGRFWGEYRRLASQARTGRVTETDLFMLRELVTEAKSFGVTEDLLSQIVQLRRDVAAQRAIRTGAKGAMAVPKYGAKGLEMAGRLVSGRDIRPDYPGMRPGMRGRPVQRQQQRQRPMLDIEYGERPRVMSPYAPSRILDVGAGLSPFVGRSSVTEAPMAPRRPRGGMGGGAWPTLQEMSGIGPPRRRGQ